MYKIEAYANGQWDSAAVGHPNDNQFETRTEAEKQIPKLAKIFDCPNSELRVVVIEQALCPKCSHKMHMAGLGWSGHNRVQRYRCNKCGTTTMKRNRGEPN